MIHPRVPRWVGIYLNGEDDRAHYYRARKPMTLPTFVDLHRFHPVWKGWELVAVSDGPVLWGGSGLIVWRGGLEV